MSHSTGLSFAGTLTQCTRCFAESYPRHVMQPTGSCAEPVFVKNSCNSSMFLIFQLNNISFQAMFRKRSKRNRLISEQYYNRRQLKNAMAYATQREPYHAASQLLSFVSFTCKTEELTFLNSAVCT